MPQSIRLDHAGIGAVLISSDVSSAVNAAAEAVASSAHWTTRSGEEIPVEVESAGVTGRRAPRETATVTLAHAAGLGVEAKYGVLAEAAAAAGLEVKARKGGR